MVQEYKDGDYVYDTIWLSMRRAIMGNAVYSGLGSSIVVDMTTRLAIGSYYAAATLVSVGTAIDFIHGAADATYDRWDIIYGNDTTQAKLEGVPEVAPKPPDLPAGAIILYMVRVRAGVTAILTADLYNFSFVSPFMDHKARHIPGGSDALATGVPSDIGTTNAEGTATAFPRQDHVHALGALSVPEAALQASAVTAAKLGALAVTTAKINDLAVTEGKLAALAVTDAKVAAANKDGLVSTPSMRTIGTAAAQACAGNDARLSDAREPTAHNYTKHSDRTRIIPIDVFAMKVSGTDTQPPIKYVALGANAHYGVELGNIDTHYLHTSIPRPYDFVSDGHIYLILGSADAAVIRIDCKTQTLSQGGTNAEDLDGITLSLAADVCEVDIIKHDSSYGWASNDSGLRISIRRNATHADDTYAASVFILGGFVAYTADM